MQRYFPVSIATPLFGLLIHYFLDNLPVPYSKILMVLRIKIVGGQKSLHAVTKIKIHNIGGHFYAHVEFI